MRLVHSAGWSAVAVVLAAACSGPASHTNVSKAADPKASIQPRLPTGNFLDPAAPSTPLGSFPLAAVLSPEGDRVVVLLNGWREQGVQVVDRATGNIVQTLVQPAAFIGLEFAPDRKTLYASGGNQDVVYRYSWENRTAAFRDSIVLAHKPDQKKSGTRYPAGLRVSHDGKFLYVAENLSDDLAIVDLASGQVVQRVPVGRYPYGVAEGKDGAIYVSLWGAHEVVVVSPYVQGQQTPAVVGKITVGRHPSVLEFNPDGEYLFAISGSTDRVSVIDTETRRVVADMQSSPPGTTEGSTPNAIAFSKDGRIAYVAESDNNAVAVWQLSPKPELLGRVPVEWYPTALISAGDSLLVITGKGKGTAPNPALPHPGTGTQNNNDITRHSYTLGQLNGSFMTLTSAQLGGPALAQLTQRVSKANGWGQARTGAVYPPFEHVIYIIKENRTYDQVFGDMAQGDGDSSLVFFGRNISPNHHALADRFGLFDRFFVNAEVSADGHNWSTAAYGTDYLEKTVPSNYSGRGRSYDYEGTNRDEIPYEHGADDAAEAANGYIWDLAQRANVSLRNYGEFVLGERQSGEMLYRGTKPFLAAHTNEHFPEFDLNIPDQRRVDVWLEDLRQFVKDGKMPQLQIMRLPNDHTAGARAGSPTPRAFMADNDLALGRVVEALSSTPFWKSTVIFVLEDDAQNGPDHIDSHRSPLLVISPYNRPGVIHRFANTTDVIATIAEILHMGTLSQFDYYGRPLRDVFAKEPDLRPYKVLNPGVSLGEKNPPRGTGAIQSRQLKLAREDQSDDDLFNRILWRAIKGNQPYPGSTRMSALEVQRK